MPCNVVVGYQGFGGPCCLHLQGEAEDFDLQREDGGSLNL